MRDIIVGSIMLVFGAIFLIAGIVSAFKKESSAGHPLGWGIIIIYGALMVLGVVPRL